MGKLLKEQVLAAVRAEIVETGLAKSGEECRGEGNALRAKFAGVLSPALERVAGINGASLRPTGLKNSSGGDITGCCVLMDTLFVDGVFGVTRFAA